MSQTRYCSNCGAALMTPERFCPNCGAKLETLAQPQSQPYGVPPPPPPPPQPNYAPISQPYFQPPPLHQFPVASMLQTREFIVDQKLLSVRNTYVIKNRQGTQLGFVKQEFLTLGPHFWFEDTAGNHIGEIIGKVLTIHNEYEIKDIHGQTRAKVKKKILKLIGSEWWMEDAFGNEIARVKGNFIHHTYEMDAPDNTIIAKVHKNWVAVRDTYCIEIVNPYFDPLLVLGYAIALDNVEHQDKQSNVHFV